MGSARSGREAGKNPPAPFRPSAFVAAENTRRKGGAGPRGQGLPPSPPAARSRGAGRQRSIPPRPRGLGRERGKIHFGLPLLLLASTPRAVLWGRGGSSPLPLPSDLALIYLFLPLRNPEDFNSLKEAPQRPPHPSFLLFPPPHALFYGGRERPPRAGELLGHGRCLGENPEFIPQQQQQKRVKYIYIYLKPEATRSGLTRPCDAAGRERSRPLRESIA